MRLNPDIVLEKISPNQSSRTSAKLRLIVLHSTESLNVPGTGDLAGVASWFANPASQASAHVIVDADGHSARCVHDNDKAWHCAGFNDASLGIEQVGRASQGKWARDELFETARWIAHWSLKFDIPIQRGKVQGNLIRIPGVVTHEQLGSFGGGHTDPGDSYPVHDVIERAWKFRKTLREEHK